MSHSPERLGIIGAGNIATELAAVLARSLQRPLSELSVLVRQGQGQRAEGAFAPHAGEVAAKVRIHEDAAAFAAAGPGLVVEAAGHSAVSDYVVDLLRNGIETVVASTGALSDAALHKRLEEAAIAGGARLILPAGAVGGMDILSALKQADLQDVIYTGRKPPKAWKGTAAETVVDLDAIESEAVLFRGSAREAAALYPKNANVAATVALAGLGFDNTRVVLIADPGAHANIHTVDVASDVAGLSMQISGHPSPDNPKTSLQTVYSLAREVLRRQAPIVS